MVEKIFFDDSLINIFVPFVERVSLRVDLLLKHEVFMRQAFSANQDDKSFQETLIEGACEDLIREVRSVWEFVLVSQRNLSADSVRDFVYLMAAFSDEVLIVALPGCLPHRLSGAVERGLFGSMEAGEQIFLRIDRIIGRRSELDVGIAAVYLWALCLGFKGRFLSQGQEQGWEQLERYRRELSAFAVSSSEDVQDSRRTVVGAKSIPWFPTSLQIKTLWASVATVWLVASLVMSITWSRNASQLDPVTESLESNFRLKNVFLDGTR